MYPWLSLSKKPSLLSSHKFKFHLLRGTTLPEHNGPALSTIVEVANVLWVTSEMEGAPALWGPVNLGEVT